MTLISHSAKRISPKTIKILLNLGSFGALFWLKYKKVTAIVVKKSVAYVIAKKIIASFVYKNSTQTTTAITKQPVIILDAILEKEFFLV